MNEKSLDEPVIVETHQNNFTISSFDEHSIVHDPTSPGGVRYPGEGDSLVIEQQASTLDHRSQDERTGTIDNSMDDSGIPLK